MSREAFEECLKRLTTLNRQRDGEDYKSGVTTSCWLFWQAAESHTARECERIAKSHGEHWQAWPHDAIRAAYPDAFKE